MNYFDSADPMSAQAKIAYQQQVTLNKSDLCKDLTAPDATSVKLLGQKYEPLDLAASALQATAYSGIQSPYKGLSQLINHSVGSTILPDVDLIPAPKAKDALEWHAQMIGSAVGMILPFMATKSGLSALGRVGAAACLGTELKTATILSNPWLKASIPILESAGAGFAYELTMRPNSNPQKGFWQERFENAGAGALSFGTLAGASIYLRERSVARYAGEAPWLVDSFSRDLTRNVVAGGIAGVVDAESRSLLEGKGFASLSELGQSAYSFALIGGAMRGGREAIQRGVLGNQTIADTVAERPELQRQVLSDPREKGLISAFGWQRLSQARAGTSKNAYDLALKQTAKAEDASNLDWYRVYKASFPIEERQPLSEVMELIRDGNIRLNVTRDRQNNPLSFTLTSVHKGAGNAQSPDFLLMDFMATDPNCRSLGVGGMHVQGTKANLEAEFKNHAGWMIEIESTKEAGLDPATQSQRDRRLAFYLNNGAKLYDTEYGHPDWTDATNYYPGQFLCLEFGRPNVGPNAIYNIYKSIYLSDTGYHLSTDHPMLHTILSQPLLKPYFDADPLFQGGSK